MLDFKELDKNGDDFELLVRELLYNRGLEVYWSGKGPDGGKDLLCIETYKSHFKSLAKRWLIQCKHNAHSGNSVGTAELGNIQNSCLQHNADGYLLVCSTYPSSSVVNTLDGIERNSNIITAFWDYRALERQLLIPENWSLINMFFPISAQKLHWQISKIDTYFWHANYKGNIFYIALRIGTNCDHYLSYIADRIDELGALDMPKGHYLRIRAVYFDDKYTNFMLFLDYLIPSGTKQEEINPPKEVINFCQDRIIDGICYDIDLKIYEYNGYSDNFDLDHQSYYSYFISNFKSGYQRNKSGNLYTVFRDDPFSFSESLTIDAFTSLSDAFRKLPFVRVLKATNAQIEKISFFTDNFSWEDTIESTDYNINNFFATEIRFECQNFTELCNLLSTFPQSVNQHFCLEQNHIFLPDLGYDKEENTIYTLKLNVHPAIAISKLQFRNYLNQYMIEIKDAILTYLSSLPTE